MNQFKNIIINLIKRSTGGGAGGSAGGGSGGGAGGSGLPKGPSGAAIGLLFTVVGGVGLAVTGLSYSVITG